MYNKLNNDFSPIQYQAIIQNDDDWRADREYSTEILVKLSSIPVKEILFEALFWVLEVCFNSWRMSDAYMHQYTMPSLVQIMACRLFGDNPLSEPMMVYCQFDPKGHIPMKLKYKSFHSKKCRLQEWRPSCLGLSELKTDFELIILWYQFSGFENLLSINRPLAVCSWFDRPSAAHIPEDTVSMYHS